MGLNPDQLSSELQADFFAEADEHLRGIRRALIALEPQVNQPAISPSLLDSLFRHFHSLKGLAGMFSLREAEDLAHRMEHYLRLLRQKAIILSPAGMDALSMGTRDLEHVIIARRNDAPMPDISNALLELDRVAPSATPPNAVPAGTATGLASPTGAAGAAPSPGAGPAASMTWTALNPQSVEALESALERGARAWRWTFTPSVALSERGISVTNVRERLSSVGEVVHAAPHITPLGDIAFEFIVASDVDESTFASWGLDGVTYAAYNHAPANGMAPDAASSIAAPAMVDRGIAPVTIAPANLVRVELKRLDELLRIVGDLIISRARLDDALDHLDGNIPAPQRRALAEVNTTLEHQLRDLRQAVMGVRLVPIGEVFERMHYVVRDLAREIKKPVRVVLLGGETQIDKLVVERILDPLLHLVRNAISHGLESPDERTAAGKPPEGTLTLSAAAMGDVVIVEVEDDGRGMDEKAIVERARSLGLISIQEPTGTPSMLDIICLPGFTTRQQADRASGRGIGMSVVKSVVEQLGGTLAVETQAGRGTRFTLELPLTLSIVDALLVRVGAHRFAIPLPAVREVFEVKRSSISVFENNEVTAYRQGVLALARLACLFNLPECTDRSSAHIVVVGTGANPLGLVVDRILGQREIVVHALADPLVKVRGISGATELGDGRVVLIVDTAAISRLVRDRDRSKA